MFLNRFVVADIIGAKCPITSALDLGATMPMSCVDGETSDTSWRGMHYWVLVKRN